MTQRLAVDIGGTFVDSIVFEHGPDDLSAEKTSTTPRDPTDGVVNGIDKLGVELTDTDTFVHGTTLGINAFLEREGATTGIITNEGFSDVFELGRHNVPAEEMYNIRYEKPESLVRRRRRVGVPGRIDADGEEVEPLDTGAVQEAAGTLIEDHGVESIAVCFLNAYRNDEHEVAAAAAIEDAYPDVSVSVSSEITREYREYERTSTTVLDAYIKPIFRSYVDRLDSTLADRGFDGEFFVTRSGGGAMSAAAASDAPVHTIFSGPAGGLIGSTAVGEATGREDLIAIDMGGTSLDACVIKDGSPAVEYETDLENFPLMIPVYDLRTIGAGGGSIAWLDRNLLKVGPKSAGADPGPICYGQGGEEPTVTDAAVALGYLDPESFLGGDMRLEAEAAVDGIRERLAEPLDQSVRATSRGVFEVLLANTVSAVREITVEKGLDPRDFSAVAYGGAGPMFVPLLARELNAGEVIVPQLPGVFSAWGMLMADVVYDFSQTNIALLENTGLDELEPRFEALEADAAGTLADEGYEPADRRLERSAEMRYHGQEHTVEVDADADSIAALRERFEARHESRYGHAMDDPAEIVHLRVRGIGVNDKPPIQRWEPEPEDPELGTREAYCFAADERVPFGVYGRQRLDPGTEIDGPAIVQEDTTTTVFFSDQRATVDDHGHLVIRGGDQ